jgi:FtsZ-binding cell division protein ZapB
MNGCCKFSPSLDSVPPGTSFFRPFVGLLLLVVIAVASPALLANPQPDQPGAASIAEQYDFARVQQAAVAPPPLEGEQPLPAEYESLRQRAYELTQEVAQIRDQADQLTHEFRMVQEQNRVYESLLLVGFALVALPVVLWFLTTKTIYTASHVVNAAGLVLIVFGTILLVILADAEAQLTASMGILGAVAGYLFGTMRRGDAGEEPIVGKAVKRSEAGDKK